MIKDIINKKIIYATTKNSIKEIALKMKKYNIGFIPIKENNKYVGVITDRDICLLLTTINDINSNIKSLIKTNIIFANSCDTISTALNLMKKHKIKRLLVKEKDNIIGILSLSDILNYTDININDTCKSIFCIHNNIYNTESEIDEFYL